MPKLSPIIHGLREATIESVQRIVTESKVPITETNALLIFYSRAKRTKVRCGFNLATFQTFSQSYRKAKLTYKSQE